VRAADSGAIALPEFLVEEDGRSDVNVWTGASIRPLPLNLAPQLRAIPGVYLQTRAAEAGEPSLRGLSFDRVATTLNGIPLINASPERTFSPVTLLGAAAIDRVEVFKALPSVTFGPIATGGLVSVTTSPAETHFQGPERTAGEVMTRWSSDRPGLSAAGRTTTFAGAWFAQISFSADDLGDYRSADGRTVAARLRDLGVALALGWRGWHSSARLFVLERRLQRQEAVSLPLDAKNTESQIVVVNGDSHPEVGPLDRVEWRFGGSSSDPYITSEDRRGAPMTFARATARSLAGTFALVWRAPAGGSVTTGADGSWQSRRAVRTSTTGEDYIWPGAVYADRGGFVEWLTPMSGAGTLRIGGRLDDVRSDAHDASRLALGRPIRDQYVTYNGPAASAIARHDTATAVNGRLESIRGGAFAAFVGTGISAQPAPVTERYRAMLNALGGDGRGGNAFELGNPGLAAERSWATETGGTWTEPHAVVKATLYYYRIDDYILRTPIGMTNPPLPRLVVFGYRNVDAEFFGGELTALLRPPVHVSVPLSFATSRGKRRDTGAGLADLPPWEATAGLRSEPTHAGFSAEVGVRIVGEKRNPAPLDNPLFTRTGGFALWHLAATLPLGQRLRFDFGCENLLDRDYREYLVPPVAPLTPASGTLQPNERVPGRGRSGWFSATYRF
jgi:iron complex outermembrane receptor protein